MNAVAYIALIAWPIVALGLASWLRVPKGIVASCVIAWLFLPHAAHDLPGPVDLSKVSMTSLSLLLGLVIVDPARLSSFRPAWFDLPIVIYILGAVGSSVSNGLGVYDGFSEATIKTLTWGVPWLVGRVCLRSIEDLRVLVLGIILGGLAYVPLCLYEVRMSPQLHRILYGFFPHDEFAQTRRFGGFRPTVFMQHGLMVGMWMCASALAGVWMAQGGKLRAILGLPMWIIAPVQVVTAVLCKSAGAIALGVAGWVVLVASRAMRTRALLLLVAVIPMLYIAYRAVDGPTSPLVDLVRSVPVLGQRVDSFEYRLEADDILLDHARRKTLLGWGGQGRHRPLNDEGDELARTDSLWVITLGQNGMVGAAGLYATLCLPLLLTTLRVRPRELLAPENAPLLVSSVITGLYACDSLFNAMFNPVYLMAGGGVMSTLAAQARRSPTPPLAARAPAANGPSPAPQVVDRLRAAIMGVPPADVPRLLAHSDLDSRPIPPTGDASPARDTPAGALSPVVAHLRPRAEADDRADADEPAPPRLVRPDEAQAEGEALHAPEPPSPHPFPTPSPDTPPDRLSIPWRAPRS